MKVWININGFDQVTDELIFDRTVALPLDAVRRHLDAELVGDDLGLAHTYAISESAVRDLLLGEALPTADWFVGQVTKDVSASDG
ncbi:hypothetical protein [Bosea sp. ANAM02]|uniref:hypothetical protein n=1 Tax=Bosea sp. ANAM02 TaxID=2020412 RepID=UPI00140EE361|nr:hypothetical protein [Bosea sp. ANAM02]BCB22011.1 hypothetical protein OCUBac02_49050 [Bosea sp. ANAM02]